MCSIYAYTFEKRLRKCPKIYLRPFIRVLANIYMEYMFDVFVGLLSDHIRVSRRRDANAMACLVENLWKNQM